MVRVAGWLVVVVTLSVGAPAQAGGHRDLDAYQRAYGWYAPGQYVHDDHRYELGAHGIAYRGTERPAWRWCDERGEWVRIGGDLDLGWQGGIDPAEVHARVPRHLHDPSLRAAHGYEHDPAYAGHVDRADAAGQDRAAWRHARRHARD